MRTDRDTVMANPSVSPSVRLSVSHTRVLYRKNAHRQTLSFSGMGMTLIFSAVPPLQNSKVNSLSGGVKYTRWENLRFSSEIAIYLGNGMR